MDWGAIVKPNANIFEGRSPNKCRTRLFLIWVLRFWQERIGPDGDKIHCAARHVLPNKLDSVKVNMKIQGNLWTLDAISGGIFTTILRGLAVFYIGFFRTSIDPTLLILSLLIFFIAFDRDIFENNLGSSILRARL